MTGSPLFDQLLGTKLPAQLYHYTSVAGLHGILSSRTAWATAVQYLNDAKEYTLAIDLARSRLLGRTRTAPDEAAGALLRDMRDQLERMEHLHVCVFSLSEERDLLSQWRGYCPPGAGYAIGFLAPELRVALGRQNCLLAPCVYDQNRQRVLVHEAVDPVIEDIIRTRPAEAALRGVHFARFASALARVAPLVKHTAFSEEKEWRAVWQPTPGNVAQMQHRVGRTMLIPYVPLQLEFSGHPAPFGQIVIGPTPHMYIANNALLGFITRNGVPWTNVTPSHTPYRLL